MFDEATDASDRYSAPFSDDVSSAASPASRGGPRIWTRGRRSFWTVLTVTGALLLVGAYWAGTRATSPSSLGRQQAPAPPTQLTASVVFRRLSETLPVQGSVAAESGYQVSFGQVSVPGAQPIVTQQPPGPGARIANGSLLAQIAGRPVFALLGDTPMYRDLGVGDRGPDVAQLQADLAALGYFSHDTPGVFDSSTLQAVRAFYGYRGYSLFQPAGTLSVSAAPLSTSLASPSVSPRPSASSPSPSTSSPSSTSTPSVSPSASSVAPSKTALASASASSPPPPSPIVPQADVVFIPRLPATVQSSSLKLGLAVTNPAMTLSTQELRVVVPLTSGQVELVQPKDTASLRITRVGGTVTELAATVTEIRAQGQGAQQSGPVAVLRTSKPLGWSLIGAQATGTIVIASTRSEVLAVPVAALYTAADGQTLVTVVAHGGRSSVPVQVGAEIGGYVPVRPVQGQLAAGDAVLVGQ